MKSRKRFFGDLSVKDLENSRSTQKNWNIISNTIFNLRKKVRNLRQTRRRLKSRIICFNSLMKYLRENTYNISECAELTIQVKLSTELVTVKLC